MFLGCLVRCCCVERVYDHLYLVCRCVLELFFAMLYFGAEYLHVGAEGLRMRYSHLLTFVVESLQCQSQDLSTSWLREGDRSSRSSRALSQRYCLTAHLPHFYEVERFCVSLSELCSFSERF